MNSVRSFKSDTFSMAMNSASLETVENFKCERWYFGTISTTVLLLQTFLWILGVRVGAIWTLGFFFCNTTKQFFREIFRIKAEWKGVKTNCAWFLSREKELSTFQKDFAGLPKGGIKKANHISFRSVGIREKKDVEESRMDYMRKSSWKRI